MSTDTLTQKYPSATEEEVRADWEKRFLRDQRKFGTLPQIPWQVICDCCGNIHLNDGKMAAQLAYDRPIEKMEFQKLSDYYQKMHGGRERYEAYTISDAVGIYSAENMTAERLIETVGLSDAQSLEFTDESGATHSLAWKDE